MRAHTLMCARARALSCGRARGRAPQDAEELYHTNAIAAIPLTLYGLKAVAYQQPLVVADGPEQTTTALGGAAHGLGLQPHEHAAQLPSKLLVASVFSFVNCLEPPYHFSPQAIRIVARACALLEPTVEHARLELDRAAGALLHER
jgi:hypothetical protein